MGENICKLSDQQGINLQNILIYINLQNIQTVHAAQYLEKLKIKQLNQKMGERYK